MPVSGWQCPAVRWAPFETIQPVQMPMSLTMRPTRISRRHAVISIAADTRCIHRRRWFWLSKMYPTQYPR